MRFLCWRRRWWERLDQSRCAAPIVPITPPSEPQLLPQVYPKVLSHGGDDNDGMTPLLAEEMFCDKGSSIVAVQQTRRMFAVRWPRGMVRLEKERGQRGQPGERLPWHYTGTSLG